MLNVVGMSVAMLTVVAPTSLLHQKSFIALDGAYFFFFAWPAVTLTTTGFFSTLGYVHK